MAKGMKGDLRWLVQVPFMLGKGQVKIGSRTPKLEIGTSMKKERPVFLNSVET
ncbi:hypothetical protein Amal_03331 [Acetobacter malorum]|uniref:Uncharacterized protein n=2 Tax=Acetobacter TaxID=434 RepID=A0A177G5B0_9PROT|nr:hypothetical protein Amal_03331 [Acetobacter malorum]